MKKKIGIVLLFLLVFAAALGALFVLNGKKEQEAAPQQITAAEVPEAVSDSVYTYRVHDVTAGCDAEDKIFCAIEKTVKCTLAPELDGCNKESVPGFVLGKVDEEVRPTEISFSITKMKMLPAQDGISVYTKSDCNAGWFGLCKGTVIYSLVKKGEDWAVNNVYALED
jgi:hypothetical protein